MAQDVKPVALPTVENPISGFPAGQVTDVLRLSIGMPSKAAIEELRSQFPDAYTTPPEDLVDKLGYVYRETSRSVGAQIADGFQVVFEEMPIQVSNRAMVVTADSKDYTYEGTTFKVGFGSNATGNLVQIIVRDTLFEAPANREDLIASISEKYGEPTFVKNVFAGEDEIYYLYKDGAVVVQEADTPPNYNSTTSNSWETGDELFNQGDLFYSHKVDRAMNDRCSAAMTFKLSSSGARDDEVLQMRVYIIDHDAIYQDRKAIDEAIDEAYDAYLSAPAGSGEAPKL